MNSTLVNENAIQVSDLSMSFGAFKALDRMNLEVKRGTAMALLGENGAGKTTTLRILTNIYKATAGHGTILNKPLGCDDSELFQRIGYVSENQNMPMRWTLKKLIEYLKPQYPTWDDAFCSELIHDFDLPLDRRLGNLSRGMQMKASLVTSLAYRPELLLLDEPFSGLDPLVREEFIDGVLELMDGGNWTLLLSSHDIHEVERLCDSVTIIDRGQAVISEELETLQHRFRRWSIHSSAPCNSTDFPEDWLLVEEMGSNNWTFVESKHDPASSIQTIQNFFGPLTGHESQPLSLRDIYLVLAKDKKRRRRQTTAA